MTNVPLGGQPRQTAPPWERQQMREFNAGVGVPVAAGTTWTRREPARAPTREDVLVPVSYSLVTGIALGGVGLVVAMWQGWSWYLSVGVTVIAFAVTWLTLMGQFKAMLWRVEEVTGRDLDADQQVGHPEPQAQTIRLELTQPQAKAMSFVDVVGITEHELLKVARLALRDNLTQRDVNLPRHRWNALRDELIARRLLCWTDESNHSRGVTVTDLGRQTFESLLNVSESRAGESRPTERPRLRVVE